MPNSLLARYFHAHGVFGDLDFAAMKETQPDELFAAWLDLSIGSSKTDISVLYIFSHSRRQSRSKRS